jgi:rod shape-determining protein MreC
MNGKELELHWIHGLVAVIISLSMLVTIPHFPFFRSLMEQTSRILAIPEYPAVLLRDSIRKASVWVEDKQETRDEIENLKRENMRLKGLLGMQQARSLMDSMNKKTTGARVTFRPPSSWWAEIRINRGKKDGVKVGLPVLGDGFVIGRIAGVENNSSWVELITSSSMMIPVVVDETRELAVIAGDGKGKAWLMYLPESSSVSKGMTVSTALVSESLPPGLPIGRVNTDITRIMAGTKAFNVVFGGNLSKLLYVDIYDPGRITE